MSFESQFCGEKKQFKKKKFKTNHSYLGKQTNTFTFYLEQVRIWRRGGGGGGEDNLETLPKLESFETFAHFSN